MSKGAPSERTARTRPVVRFVIANDTSGAIVRHLHEAHDQIASINRWCRKLMGYAGRDVPYPPLPPRENDLVGHLRPGRYSGRCQTAGSRPPIPTLPVETDPRRTAIFLAGPATKRQVRRRNLKLPPNLREHRPSLGVM